MARKGAPPSVEYPPDLDMPTRLVSGAFVGLAFYCLYYNVTSDPIESWRRAVAIPLAIPGLMVCSALLFPPDRHLFNKKQKAKLLFNREIYFSVPVLALAILYMQGKIRKDFITVLAILCAILLIYFGSVLFSMRREDKEKQAKRKAKHPLGEL